MHGDPGNLRGYFDHDICYYSSRLLLSGSQMASLKYFDRSAHRHIRFAEFRKKINQNNHFSQMNM